MRRLIIPIAILLTAYAAERRWFPMPFSSETLMRSAQGLFLVAFLLTWRFRQGRLATVAVLLAAVAEMRHLPFAQALLPVVAFLLPLHLVVFAWMREWWVGSVAGASRFAILALEGAFLGFLGQNAEEPWATHVLAKFKSSWLDLPSLGVPQPATFVFLLTGVLLMSRLARRRSPLEAGFLGLLMASFLALRGMALGSSQAVVESILKPTLEPIPSLYWAVAGLLLVLTPLENAFSLAFEDGLTGLPARRALEENLRHMGRVWAVAMVDIDHFKKLNDRHGHEVGDQVLRMVARELERLGGGGKAFRYGGEEFTLLFPGCSAEEAADHADELRRRIAGRQFAVRSPLRPKKKPQGKGGKAGGEKQLKVKVSIGVAERSERLATPAQVLKAADKALYRSKKAGRNRVTVGK